MGLLLAAVLLAVPIPANAQPGSDPVFEAGKVATAITYGAAVFLGSSIMIGELRYLLLDGQRMDGEAFLLFIPVAGPLLVVNNASGPVRFDPLSRAFLYVDAAAQAVAFSVLLLGLARRSRDPSAWRPVAGPGGLGLVRRF